MKTEKSRVKQQQTRRRRRVRLLLAAALNFPVLSFGVPVMAADPLATMGVVTTERGKEAPDFTLPPRYNARGHPTTILIGRNGRIIGRIPGERDWGGEAARELTRWLLAGKE
jgi:hypothetical protein